MWIIGKSVTLGDVTSHDGLLVEGTNGQLHVLDDYIQDGGDFMAVGDAIIRVDDTFTKTGNGAFGIHSPNFSIGNPAASSIEAGDVHIDVGSTTVRDFTAHGNVTINNPGVSVHLLGDYAQTDGSFSLFSNATLQVDGTSSRQVTEHLGFTRRTSASATRLPVRSKLVMYTSTSVQPLSGTLPLMTT